MNYSNDDVSEISGDCEQCLMEDMNELVQQKCWMYLQLLNAMTNTVQISTAAL